MERSNAQRPLCSSVFQSGEHTTTTEAFTHKWIELVNSLEKGKGMRA